MRRRQRGKLDHYNQSATTLTLLRIRGRAVGVGSIAYIQGYAVQCNEGRRGGGWLSVGWWGEEEEERK
jgi:hypothetical protein